MHPPPYIRLLSDPPPAQSPTTSLGALGLESLAMLEALQEEGRWAEAEMLAADLLERWPTVPVVIVEVARLHARKGRRDEAIDLLLSGHVGKNVRVLNYRFCTRLAKSA